MQATSTTRRFHLHPAWVIAAIIAVLVAVLVVGGIVTMKRDDSLPAPASVRSVVEPKTNENLHFAEMNAFPETTSARMRAIDRQQFIEMNRLHDAPSTPARTYASMLFDEMNTLPDHTRPVIPASDPRRERH